MSDEAEQLESGQETEAPEVSEVEQKARDMGWAPKEEFRGDPERWVDAETFVKRGEEHLPILRERYGKLQEELREIKDTVKQFAEHHSKVEKKAYERALKDLQAKREKAFEEGDKDAFKEADKEFQELIKEGQQEAPKAKEDGVHPDFHGWVRDNAWYQSDAQMHAYADSVAGFVAQQNPGVEGKALFDLVKDEVKKRFPERFENPRRKQPAAVEGSQQTGRGKSKPGYQDLPAEAKAACDKFVKQGLMTKEQYVKEYFEA